MSLDRNTPQPLGHDDRAPSAEPEGASAAVTQDGVALAFAHAGRHKWRYCHETASWYRWSGYRWERDCSDLVIEQIRDLARQLSRGGDARLLRDVRRLPFIRGVEVLCRSDSRLVFSPAARDRDPLLLATPSGTVDLRTGKMRQADPDDGITKLTSVAPADTEDCPRWIQFIKEVTGGDVGMIRFLQQVCGYFLTGSNREQALFFFHGDGGTGKTVFQVTVTSILGDYATTAPMEAFIASRNDRHPTELAMLRGARLVAASEIDDGRAWAEGRIKQITGGEPITARYMRQDFFTYSPEFKLLIVANHAPVLRVADEAMRRRFNVIPFDQRPKSRDPSLLSTLRIEAPGILRWMIEGCLDWQQNGLIRPDAVSAASASYLDEQDLIGQWLAEHCVVDVDRGHVWTATADLFASWRQYLADASEPPARRRSFGDEMKRRGFAPHRNMKARGFEGIKLKSSAPTPDGMTHDVS